MKKQKKEYQRSLSAGEWKDAKLMVTKDGLGFFPKPFRKFSLEVGEKKFDLAVESVDCHCMGSAQAHQHYWLPIKQCMQDYQWTPGTRITIRKEKDLVYRLLLDEKIA